MLLLNGAVKALLVLLIVTVFFNSVGCWFHTLRYRYSVAEFTSFEYLLFFPDAVLWPGYSQASQVNEHIVNVFN